MASWQNVFGLAAAILIALSEGFASIRLRLAGILLLVAISLLLASFRRSSFVLAFGLAFTAGIARLLYQLPSNKRDSFYILGRLAPSGTVGFFHLLGVWILPFMVLWGWCDAFDREDFFIQEIGHLVPATFYYFGLVLLPLFIMRRGYEKGGLEHQLFEGTFCFFFSIVYFLIFRLVHWSQGENPPTMSASNWDHEFLGLVWSAAGAVGVLMAWAECRTSIHMAFPAIFVCYQMLSHSHAHHADGMTMNNGWKLTWMQLHQIHGICFGVGALCRVLYRLPEAVFFFFIGAVTFVFSAKGVVQALHNSLSYDEDPEYPTNHVASLLVVTLGTVLFPIHFAALDRLRLFVEQQFMSTAFSAVPVNDDGTDETLLEELEDVDPECNAD
jgi:hypothetical protein